MKPLGNTRFDLEMMEKNIIIPKRRGIKL